MPQLSKGSTVSTGSKLPRRDLRSAVLDPQTEWSRRRLQVLFGGVVLVALAVVGGGVWSVAALLIGTSSNSGAPTGTAGAGNPTRTEQDLLADQRLPAAPLDAAQPGDLSSGQTGTIVMPTPMQIGAVGVATGVPHTAEGALAQLAAIDAEALTSADVRVAQDVIGQWAVPGGPTTRSWSGVHAVAGLLEAAGMPSDGSRRIAIGVEPAMGFIKGTVGDDFVIPCIDFIVTATPITAAAATATSTATNSGGVAGSGRPQQVAASDCQRMVWHPDTSDATNPFGGRWLIGPGDEPAAAPSLWPGSQASFDAGYQWLEVPQ